MRQDNDKYPCMTVCGNAKCACEVVRGKEIKEIAHSRSDEVEFMRNIKMLRELPSKRVKMSLSRAADPGR